MEVVAFLLAVYGALMATKDWSLQALNNELVEITPQRLDEKKTIFSKKIHAQVKIDKC